jgi:hypothetical protein
VFPSSPYRIIGVALERQLIANKKAKKCKHSFALAFLFYYFLPKQNNPTAINY